MVGEGGAFRDMSPAAADLLKTYSGVSFKLVKAGQSTELSRFSLPF